MLARCCRRWPKRVALELMAPFTWADAAVLPQRVAPFST